MVAKSRKRKAEEAGAAQPVRSPMPNWTISVRDFGRVASADIEMAPMVVLVGKNNTGKSYMASLLWAMMNADEFLFRNEVELGGLSKSNHALAAKLEKLAKKANWTKSEQISPVEDHLFDGSLFYLNELMGDKKNEIFKRLFSYASNVGSIQLAPDPESRSKFCVKAVPAPHDAQIGDHWSGSDDYSFHIADGDLSIGSLLIIQSLVNKIVLGVPGHVGRERPVFIPAARTGLMIAFNTIIAGLFEGLGIDGDKQRSRLPLPVARFLRCFTDLHAGNVNKLTPIVAALENELIEGRVDASKDPVPSFWYEPDLLKTQLPLHATSSMITELAPFLLLLKNGFSEHGLVFEEPEAHLHISAQRTLARLLVRIMNAGTRVVITTHSDTFIQQINNLMQLHAHPKRDALMKKFGYTAEDLLDPAMVKGYEFNPTKNGKTIVTPTKMNPGGLVVPSLNETLIDLAEELRALQSD